ncbi:hypothetical protein [Streptomyces sp. NBC_01296]|uniref:hypothetical protein n=1 Tax=Streptomyces sp. NBC_01296 TaxID=2903816 RepID=UPI002E134346|nr:hypothetical protein OG299_42460 [Streptomyces sp. NBC_01296]
MLQLADRLTELATGSEPITFSAIGLPPDTVVGQASDVAAGPLAPFLAEAVADAYNRGDEQWQTVGTTIPPGLATQPSVLHLTASLDALLDSAPAAKALGKPLTNALLNDFLARVEATPLLAAAQLEGAVRLAIAEAVSPFKVWQALEEVPADGPEDFLERLPRILGLTLDRWAHEDTIADRVRDLLVQLTHDEAADADAMFELGCDLLRRALSSKTVGDVSTHLVQACRHFTRAAQADEARHDAETFAAVCDAIMAFSRHDSNAIADAADRVANLLDQREAWIYRTHQPAWLQPRRSAEIAWHELVLQLRGAANALNEDAWLDGWEALGTVLTAYQASRTVQPMTGDGGHGLAFLVQPVIEDSFLRQQAFLAQLRRATQETERHADRGFDAETANALLNAIENTSSRREARDASASAGQDHSEEDDPDRAPLAYLQRRAPTLLILLGADQALRIAASLDDAQLLAIEGIAHDSDVARLEATDPLIVPKLDELMGALTEHPAFTGETRRTFSALVKQTLLFLKSRSDLTRTNLVGGSKKDEPPPFDYRRKPEGSKARKPVEADLQRDFHQWLQMGPLHNAVSVEPVDVAMGRGDVMVHFGSLRYLTEIKQDDSDNSRQYLEGRYLTQTAEYSNTNAPFGQLLVLDLTSKTATKGNLRVDESVWSTTHRPRGASVDRAVVVGVVAGNRTTPSSYSRK